MNVVNKRTANLIIFCLCIFVIIMLALGVATRNVGFVLPAFIGAGGAVLMFWMKGYFEQKREQEKDENGND